MVSDEKPNNLDLPEGWEDKVATMLAGDEIRLKLTLEKWAVLPLTIHLHGDNAVVIDAQGEEVGRAETRYMRYIPGWGPVE